MLYRLLALLVITCTLVLSTGLVYGETQAQKEQRERDIAMLYIPGTTADECLSTLNGATSLGILRLLNPANWIPVVPSECVVCSTSGAASDVCPYGNGQPVPFSLNLLPHVILRLFGLIASISIYSLLLVAVIVGIRFSLGGFSKSGTYTDTAKNLRTVFSALGVTLVSATLFIQLLYFLVGNGAAGALEIKAACFPSSNPEYVRSKLTPDPAIC